MNEEIIILDKKIEIFNRNYMKYKENNCIDNIELKESLFDVLSWFEICFKNMNQLNNSEQNKKRAIAYANNMKKHSVSIFEYTLNTLALYPSDDLFPSNDLYPSEFIIYWNELPLDKRGFINQYKCYNTFLKGKDIYTSINEIYMIIKKYYNLI